MQDTAHVDVWCCIGGEYMYLIDTHLICELENLEWCISLSDSFGSEGVAYRFLLFATFQLSNPQLSLVWWSHLWTAAVWPPCCALPWWMGWLLRRQHSSTLEKGSAWRLTYPSGPLMRILQDISWSKFGSATHQYKTLSQLSLCSRGKGLVSRLAATSPQWQCCN